jgi:hypothetical protein
VKHPLPLMPVKIDVMGKLYTIINELPPPPEDEDGADDDRDSGECDFSGCEIRVDPTEAEPMQRDTLLHEVIHAVEDAMGLKVTEHRVALLATGLLQVLRHNPNFVAYLMMPDEA